jgi:signal transduction histidine kinase/CheY-like chemotaxis protein
MPGSAGERKARDAGTGAALGRPTRGDCCARLPAVPATSRPRAIASIRSRLILLVLAVWLPAAAGLALQARATYLQQEQLARDNLRTLADSLNAAVSNEIDGKLVLARALATTRSLRDRDIDAFDAQARLAAEGSGNSVLLVDRSIQHVYTGLPTPRPVPRPPDAPFVTDAPGIFFLPRGPVSKAPAIGVYVPEAWVRPPVFNVGVPFPPAEVQTVIGRQSYPDGGLGSVFDAQQRIMGRSRDPERWIGTRINNAELRNLAAAKGSGYVQTTTLDGVASLTYLAAPNRHGWSALVALPMATLLQTARELTFQALGVSMALLVVGLVLALAAARRISGPVQELERAAGELLAQRVPQPLHTGLAEADRVGEVLRQAGLRSREAGQLLESRVAEAVAQTQEAQAKLFDARKHEAIGRLTGGVAHDFNNLLQTIQMGLQVVQRSVGEGKHTRALQAALAACGKAADQVRQLLAFGRAQPLQPQPVSLADLLLRTRELTERALGERIRLRAEIDADLPPVFADPTQLELALLNLVFNARDAMPTGGNVTIRGRLDAGTGSPMVRIDVADDGVGMDAETLARVFEPYFTTKPVGLGSGLGLPQVQAFARQSGGEALITSTPGIGTCVAMVLPPAAPGAATVPEPDAQPAAEQGEPLRILLVEDDVLVGSVVPSALGQEGHTVTLCTSADEALVLLQDGATFDVLFTDVVMPGKLTGLELVEWARIHRPTMPSVVATGYSTQQPQSRVQVLRKPYAMDDLLGALNIAVGAARARDEAVRPAAPA